ncbi:hypothetical protein PsorP6_005523 [Peronosclerospora sorghi]|uniref:Uncharacterized protein n=1 Tax=Peronosclerospora sorghi TaxID=230839 RepID=A0ACC0W2A5_9STRA|nr:hypothetical protein PsorP6_005523 [Peronosclerospora sorghi]
MYRRLSWRWNANTKPASLIPKDAQALQPIGWMRARSFTPGSGRGVNGDKRVDNHETESDSTMARIMGSDWGDRSRQPVSLPMRLYWILFALVMGNGLYTYVTGEDEWVLVEKLRNATLGGPDATESAGIEALEQKTSTARQIGSVPSSAEHVAAKPPVLTSTTGISFLPPGVSRQTSPRQSWSNN